MPRRAILVATAGALLAAGFAIVTNAGPTQSTAGSTAASRALLGFNITAQAATINASPSITSSEANARAVAALTGDRSSFSRYTLAGKSLVPGLRQVTDATGRPWFHMQPAEDDWIVIYTAPAQRGYRYITAVVLVSANTAAISGYQVLASNDPKDALPLTQTRP